MQDFEADNRLGEGNPRKMIFLCTTLRTSSSFLCEALELTGGLGAIREWLHPANIEVAKRELGLDAAESTEMVLSRIVAEYSSADGVFATKVSWDQFSQFILGL